MTLRPARIPLPGLAELLPGGLELLRGEIAIAIRIRFRKTLEQLSQSRFGELLGLCNQKGAVIARARTTMKRMGRCLFICVFLKNTMFESGLGVGRYGCSA